MQSVKLALVMLLAIFSIANGQTRKEILAGLKAADSGQNITAIKAACKIADANLHRYALSVANKLSASQQRRILPSLLQILPLSALDVRQQVLTFILPHIIDNYDSQQALTMVLRTGNTQEQMQVLDILLGLGNKAKFALATILHIYHKSDSIMRAQIIDLLAHIGQCNAAITKLLRQALKAKQEYLRCQAIYALGCLVKNNPIVLKELQACLQDKNEDIASRTAEALGKLAKSSDTQIILQLWELRKHPSAIVRIRSLHAVGQISKQRIPQVIAILQKDLRSDKHLLRLSAAHAILSLNRHSAKAIATLIRLVNTNLQHEALGIIMGFRLITPEIITCLKQRATIGPVRKRKLVLSALWNLHDNTGTPAVSYFQKLHRIERDITVKKHIARLMQGKK